MKKVLNTVSEKEISLNFSTYLHFIGFDELTIRRIKSSPRLTEEIRYKMRHCRKKNSNHEKIVSVLHSN